MREWIDFVATYPVWVKISVGVLVAAIALLLVAFKPAAPEAGDRTNAQPQPSPQTPNVGHQIVLDISDGQTDWNGLTAWATASRLNIITLAKPFEAKSFDAGTLPGVLILPLPHKRLLSDSKVGSIKRWVERGGGLLIFGYYAADSHHETNINRLTREWGVSFTDQLLMPHGASQIDTRRHVFTADETLGVRVPVTLRPQDPSIASIVAGVSSVVVLSAAPLDVEHASRPLLFTLNTLADNADVWEPIGPLTTAGTRPIIDEWKLLHSKSVPILTTFTAGRGKVAVVGSWKIATLDYADNLQLTQNLINWLRP